MEKGLDAVFIHNELNQRYLCNFSFTDGLLLITKRNSYLITDFRYYEMAEAKAFDEFLVVAPESNSAFIKGVLSDEGCKSVGFEGNYLSYTEYDRLCKDYPACSFESIGDIIERMRYIKDSGEIELMKKAQDMTDKAFAHMLKVITPNMTELEVAAELEFSMRMAGASGAAFDTIAVSGTASALPHGAPRPVKLEKGFLTMDFGAKFDGYCSDMTRTVVIGKADCDMKKLYNTVLKAQTAVLDYIQEGVECFAADKVARDIIYAEKQYHGCFGHGLGHGVGLYIHENPRLSPRSKGIHVAKGNVFTVEPGIYLYGRYGCRIEDMVTVGEDGLYNFTRSNKELIEIM